MLADSIISVIAMAGSRLSEKAWHLLEAVFTALLFGTQAILNAGMFMGIMMIPLLPYVWALLSDPNYARALGFNFYVLFLAKEFWVGRMIAFVGVAILFVALGQLLWSRRKGVELIESGLYSWVRHPQFTGIIVVIVGLTIIVGTNGSYFPLGLFQVMSLWLLQVFGYIAIAKFEEWRLVKKLGDRYRQYKRRVPFLFPIKSPQRLPEVLFSVLIAIVVWLILLFLPYNMLRIL